MRTLWNGEEAVRGETRMHPGPWASVTSHLFPTAHVRPWKVPSCKCSLRSFAKMWLLQETGDKSSGSGQDLHIHPWNIKLVRAGRRWQPPGRWPGPLAPWCHQLLPTAAVLEELWSPGLAVPHTHPLVSPPPTGPPAPKHTRCWRSWGRSTGGRSTGTRPCSARQLCPPCQPCHRWLARDVGIRTLWQTAQSSDTHLKAGSCWLIFGTRISLLSRPVSSITVLAEPACWVNSSALSRWAGASSSCSTLQPARGFLLLLPQHTLRKTQPAAGGSNFGLVNLENVPLASHRPHVLHVSIHICK